MLMYVRCTWETSSACSGSRRARGKSHRISAPAPPKLPIAAPVAFYFYDHFTIPSNFHAKLLPLSISGGYTAGETFDFRDRYNRQIKDSPGLQMKQSLQLKLGQQLTMTPQLQQAIRLLQLSTLDLQ